MRLLLAAAMASVCLAQPGGWMAMGKGGSVRADGGSTVFAYEIAAKQMAMAVLPAPPELARMQRIRVRVRSSADTALAVLLSERKPGGGNYTAIVWSPANTWQTLELSPADFGVADGANDPVDADGKLDLDQVEGVGLVDLAQFFAQQPVNSEAPIAIERASGARTLEIAGFEIVGGGPAAEGPGRRVVDSFDRGFLEWITMGGVKLGLAGKSNPTGAPALQAISTAPYGRFGLLMRRVANLDLSKAVYLSFDVASENETTLIVSLEMKNGKRFNQTIYPPGKRELFPVKVKLADFEGDGTFDPAQWKTLTLAEASGEANTIWIARMAVE